MSHYSAKTWVIGWAFVHYFAVFVIPSQRTIHLLVSIDLVLESVELMWEIFTGCHWLRSVFADSLSDLMALLVFLDFFYYIYLCVLLLDFIEIFPKFWWVSKVETFKILGGLVEIIWFIELEILADVIVICFILMIEIVIAVNFLEFLFTALGVLVGLTRKNMAWVIPAMLFILDLNQISIIWTSSWFVIWLIPCCHQWLA